MVCGVMCVLWCICVVMNVYSVWCGACSVMCVV